MDDLQKGRAIGRRYRNRRIGEFLKELELAEGRSTGIPKILRAMQQNGSPVPVFESDEDRTWFLVRLPVHEQASHVATEHETDQVTVQDKSLIKQDAIRDNSPTADQVTDQVTVHVEQLMTALTGEMSRAELQMALQLRHRRHFATVYLRPALTAELVEMTLPDKPNSRNQRYRRTAQGDALAEQIKGKNTSA